MPAQKLTKGRLVQIIIMMVVLIAAFTYRTISHKESSEVDCQSSQPCEVKFQDKNVRFLYQDSTNTLAVTKSEDLTIKGSKSDGSALNVTATMNISKDEMPVTFVISDDSDNSVKVDILPR
ncbi:hypothetical protein [Vibrio mediterranei]|uniref:Uncharacterized protein n=1 Tax=Vibrio mediterranei TaxID=689 RepID=A0A3G4V681_9VIBR|nr:hypothetical protein [Vibrio mediterranei]AYV19799.1 hypothetical protein ECB94_00170 [Vibrio mediterranei]